MAKQNQQAALKRGLLPLLLTIAGFFAFVVILAFVWINQRPSTVAFGGKSPQERVEILQELRQRETAELNSYGWVNQEEGVIRLPVERAMDLVLEEINGGQGTTN